MAGVYSSKLSHTRVRYQMRLKSIHHLIIYSRNHSTTMNTIFTTDKNSRKRYIDIRVEERDGCWCIVKASGQVGGKESISVTEVPLGYESATKRAKTVWKNLNTKATTILPMLANKWEDRENYISEPFYVQPKIDGVRLLVSNKGGISRTGKLVPGTESLGKGLEEGQYLDGGMLRSYPDIRRNHKSLQNRSHETEILRV